MFQPDIHSGAVQGGTAQNGVVQGGGFAQPGGYVSYPPVSSPPPQVFFVTPNLFRAGGLTQTTVYGQNLPTKFDYTIVDASYRPVLGTGTTFPTGTSTQVTYGQYVAINAPRGNFLLQVQNTGGVAYYPVQITD